MYSLNINDTERYEFCKPQYNREIRTSTLGNREIRVEHLTPVLSTKEREVRRREIECRLYDVFVKYAENVIK